MIKYTVLIGGEDYTKQSAIPNKEQWCLDEALDNGTITLKSLKRAEVFKPYTLFTLTKDDGETIDTYSYYIASDKVVERIGTGTYDHNLVLIEETKIGEKVVVDSCSFRNSLLHDYINNDNVALLRAVNGSYQANCEINSINICSYTDGYKLPSIQEVMQQCRSGYYPADTGTITFYIISTRKANEFRSTWRNIEEAIASGEIDYTITTSNLNEKLSFTQQGSWGIYFELQFTKNLYSEKFEVGDRIKRFANSNVPYFASFSLFKEETLPPKWTITSVVNRLFQICETQRESETPSFSFNTEQAQKYSSVLAPEFTFTKKTLKECLDEIGGFIHAIPRCDNFVWSFDELGGTEEATLPSAYVGSEQTQDIEQYCTEIDSDVDNLVNESESGTVTEPFIDGYETVRIESGTIDVRITDETAILQTELPIESIYDVEFGYIPNTTTKIGSIKPYIFERDEYNALSGIIDTFPYSKAYALYYTQGEKDIKGLAFKLPDAVSTIFKQYALINILEQVSGQNFNTILATVPFVQLAYRITYKPISNARVKQTKTDFKGQEFAITSVYNQGSNKVNSNAYGENLKGVVARLGNIDKTKTYLLPKIATIPKVGTLIDDYYVSIVTIENFNQHIKCTVGLSKDFNRLSQYIGIKNSLRMYEVSEKQVYERRIVYQDFCVIGKPESMTSSLVRDISEFRNRLKTARTNNVKINSVITRGYIGNEAIESPITLPTVSMGIGNASVFTFTYADNYSAGSTSEKEANNSQTYRVQDYTPYGDYFGRIDTLRIDFYDYLINGNPDYQGWLDIGNALPNADIIVSEYSQPYRFSTGNDKIKIYKDNAERLTFTYQINFVTNDDIIIGSQLASENVWVATETKTNGKLYILPNILSKFNADIDLTNAILQADYSIDQNKIGGTSTIVYENETAVANGKAWAVVYVENGKGKLLFGKNIKITQGQTIEMPTLTFGHKKVED